jgi:hypothetical protein
MSRAVEVLLRAEGSGALTAEQAAQLAALKASPQWGETIRSVAQNYMEDVPGLAATTQAAKEAYQKAAGSVAEDTAKKTAGLLSLKEAGKQIAARAKRYGFPLAGSAIGTAVGGPVGGAIGALAGAGTRPAMHAVRRMVAHPAVQTAMWSPISSAAKAGLNPTVEMLRRLLLSRGVPAAIAAKSAQAQEED